MDDMLNDDDHFHTADLALSAVLALSCPLAAIDRHDPQAVQFVFRRDAGLDELVELYLYGELQVEPLPYYEQLRYLHAQAYGDAGGWPAL